MFDIANVTHVSQYAYKAVYWHSVKGRSPSYLGWMENVSLQDILWRTGSWRLKTQIQVELTEKSSKSHTTASAPPLLRAEDHGPHHEYWQGGPHSQVAATIRGRRWIRSCCGFRLGNPSMLATVCSRRMHVPRLPLGIHKANDWTCELSVMLPPNRRNASTPSLPAEKAEATKAHHVSLQPFTKSILWVNIYQTKSPSSKWDWEMDF